MEQPAALPVVLSVIVPVYNVKEYLDRCLTSICSQETAGMEILLVNDCSTDGSDALCERWKERDERIRLFNHPHNAGLSAARNTGLLYARGEYVTFVDSDDALAPNTYAPNLKLFEECDADVVEFPVRIHTNGKHEEVCNAKGSCDFAEWLRAGGFRHCYAWNKIFRRALWNDEHFEEGRFFEDMLTVPKVLANARRIVCSEEGRYDYLYRAGSISNDRSQRALADLLHAKLCLYGIVRQRFGEQDVFTEYYYLQVCNTQISLCAVGGEVQLSHRQVGLKSLASLGCGWKCMLKALLNNWLGESFFRILAWSEKLRRL